MGLVAVSEELEESETGGGVFVGAGDPGTTGRLIAVMASEKSAAPGDMAGLPIVATEPELTTRALAMAALEPS